VKSATAAETGPFGVRRTTGSTAVALTFDDGPDPVNTPRILDVLRQCGVKATFCLVGYKVAMYPDVVRRIVADGHTLCNHTWEHIRQLGTYGQPRIRQDLQQTINAIHAAVPGVPVSYFRAPGGAWTRDYVTVARDMGMTPIDWDVDPWDWNSDQFGFGTTMTGHIVSTIESTVRPGSIVLSHDYQKPDTTAAYRILLPWLTARFTLIPLPPRDYDLDAVGGPPHRRG
jgi:peptidoglycan/xylan/chitin deacetylase (PgdA/CDA1 family)